MGVYSNKSENRILTQNFRIKQFSNWKRVQECYQNKVEKVSFFTYGMPALPWQVLRQTVHSWKNLFYVLLYNSVTSSEHDIFRTSDKFDIWAMLTLVTVPKRGIAIPNVLQTILNCNFLYTTSILSIMYTQKILRLLLSLTWPLIIGHSLILKKL